MVSLIEPTDVENSGPRHRRSVNRSSARTLVALPGIIVALFGLYVLAWPHQFLGIHGTASSGAGYDDGVYLGAAIRLIHGDLPYRDFLFLHPPAIALLLAPIAGIGQFVGGGVALGIARLLTLLVAASNASLVAYNLRRRGGFAMVAGGTLLAIFPLAINATHTLRLDPYVLFFSLVAVTLLFKEGEPSSDRRVLIAGIAFGFACAVKLWAVPAVLAAVVVLVFRQRQAVVRLVVGIAAGFGAACLPFFIAAPGAFVKDVFGAQLARRGAGGSDLVVYKLRKLTGADGVDVVHVPDVVVVGASIALVAAAVLWIIRNHTSFATFEWFVVTSAGLAVVGVFLTGQFYDHYAYVPFAWIALMLGLMAPRGLFRRTSAALLIIVLGLGGAAVTVQNLHHAKAFLTGSFDVASVVERTVPPNACLVVDDIPFAVIGNRFTSSKPDCPKIVDPFGTWVAGTPQRRPYSGTYPSDFVKGWTDRLNRADFVAMVAPGTSYVPWTPDLKSWFQKNFTQVAAESTIVIYQHTGHMPPPVPHDDADVAEAQRLLERGVDAENAGDADAALQYYLESIAKNPANKFAHLDAGHIYQSRGAAAEAENHYVLALRLDNNYTDALFNLAVLKTSQDKDLALSLYRRVLDLQPSNAAASLNLGLLLHADNLSDGLSYIRRAVELNPSYLGRLSAEIRDQLN